MVFLCGIRDWTHRTNDKRLTVRGDVESCQSLVHVSMCTYNQHFHQSIDQLGMVVNPACGQLNKKYNVFFLVPVHARELRLARRVQPSLPALMCSFSTLRLINLVLTHGAFPAFRDGVPYICHWASPESSAYR